MTTLASEQGKGATKHLWRVEAITQPRRIDQIWTDTNRLNPIDNGWGTIERNCINMLKNLKLSRSLYNRLLLPG